MPQLFSLRSYHRNHMQELSDSVDDLTKKRRYAYQRSRSKAIQSRTIDNSCCGSNSSSFDQQAELQLLAEFQERTRYRLIANSRRGSLCTTAASSFDEPDGLGTGSSSRQSSFRRRKCIASPIPISLKAIYRF